MKLARNVLAPVFDTLRDRVEAYDTSEKDEEVIAHRLLRWLSTVVGHGRVPLAATLPFWWSYVDVDVDMECWHGRLHLPAIIGFLMDDVRSHTVRDGIRTRGRDSLERAWRLRDLHSLVAVPGAWCRRSCHIMDVVRSDAEEERELRDLRLWYGDITWMVKACLGRRKMSFAWERVSGMLHGGPSWLDLLERAETGGLNLPPPVPRAY
jgi:hypothetical protein